MAPAPASAPRATHCLSGLTERPGLRRSHNHAATIVDAMTILLLPGTKRLHHPARTTMMLRRRQFSLEAAAHRQPPPAQLLLRRLLRRPHRRRWRIPGGGEHAQETFADLPLGNHGVGDSVFIEQPPPQPRRCRPTPPLTKGAWTPRLRLELQLRRRRRDQPAVAQPWYQAEPQHSE